MPVISPSIFTMAANAQVYLGQRAGADLYEQCGRARTSLKIVSPFLNANFIDLLTGLEQRGVTVTLLTSENAQSNEEVALKLVRQMRATDEEAAHKRRTGRIYAALSFFVCALAGVVGFLTRSPLVYAFAGSLLSVLLFIYFQRRRIYSYSYSPTLSRLKVFVSPFYRQQRITREQGVMLHAKLFLIDERVAYLGSLNFTYSGFYDNFESCIRIEDAPAVRRLSALVETLYNEEELAILGIEAWGRSLYPEPKN